MSPGLLRIDSGCRKNMGTLFVRESQSLMKNLDASVDFLVSIGCGENGLKGALMEAIRGRDCSMVKR